MSTSATAVAPVTTTKSFRFNKAPSSRRGSIRIETDGTMTYDPRTRTRWSEVWAARKKDRKALRAGLQPQGRDPHGFLVRMTPDGMRLRLSSPQEFANATTEHIHEMRVRSAEGRKGEAGVSVGELTPPEKRPRKKKADSAKKPSQGRVGKRAGKL